MAQEVFELHALLTSARVPAPYVLVGHSYGGLLVRLYTDAYPTDVRGLVLVDPTHESTRLSVQRRGEATSRWVRIRDSATGLAIPTPRGRTDVESPAGRVNYWPDELRQMYEQRLQNPVPLGDRPLIVLAGTKPTPPQGGASDELWRELVREKDLEKEDLTRLSRKSTLVFRDPSSGHHVHVDNPPIVISAIEQVMERSRTAVAKPVG